ncbi:hypothetical protein D9R06_09765 [Kocuria marina subsp. indica]|nr:hypothetical protein D9R06_09765 [Kocuria indica]
MPVSDEVKPQNPSKRPNNAAPIQKPEKNAETPDPATPSDGDVRADALPQRGQDARDAEFDGDLQADAVPRRGQETQDAEFDGDVQAGALPQRGQGTGDAEFDGDVQAGALPQRGEPAKDADADKDTPNVPKRTPQPSASEAPSDDDPQPQAASDDAEGWDALDTAKVVGGVGVVGVAAAAWALIAAARRRNGGDHAAR